MPQRMTTPYNENYITQTNYTIPSTVNWHECSFIIPHYTTKPLHECTTLDSQRAKSHTSLTSHISLKRVFSTRSHLLYCIDQKRPTSVKIIQSWPTRCIYQVCTPPLYLHLYRRIITWPWHAPSRRCCGVGDMTSNTHGSEQFRSRRWTVREHHISVDFHDEALRRISNENARINTIVQCVDNATETHTNTYTELQIQTWH